VPWKERSVVEKRTEFVLRRDAGESMTDLCREFKVSRKTGHKIYKRFKEVGLEGLYDEPRRPESSPNRTPAAIETLILEAKDRHSSWGSKKLKSALVRQHAGVKIPARSTIDEILKRNGLVPPRRQRKLVPCYPEQLTQSNAPNDVWCVDFKGQFRLGNGQLCYPLTITDHFSRYVIACVALQHPTAAAVFDVFDRVFQTYGLPRVIRSDNGTPFASRGLAGLSRLSAWWVSLGIRSERIEPGHPEQNGRHERMHRTLKQEDTRPASATSEEQQRRFDAFVAEFNQVRPHEALGMRVPADVYVPSDRAYPRPLHSVSYPLHDVTCRVVTNGVIKQPRIFPKWIFLSRAFAGHNVGLRELSDGRWLVTFAKMDLGHVSPDGRHFEPLAQHVAVRDERAHLKTRPTQAPATASELVPPVVHATA
jgi:transposase InsO family protein